LHHKELHVSRGDEMMIICSFRIPGKLSQLAGRQNLRAKDDIS
jgi:hypothetical protein